MKASQLAAAISDLIARHGDLEIYFDCDSVLTELASVGALGAPYIDPPAFVIYARQSDVESDAVDIHVPP